MYTTPTTDYYARANDDDGSGLSRQNVIIIAVCSSFGGLFLAYFLYRSIRNCLQRSDSTPHPLPQPLFHQRQRQVAQMEQRATLYEPEFAAGHSIRLDSSKGSKASLLGIDSPGVASSSIDYASTPSDSSHQHLPIPNAPCLHDRPKTSSSLASSNSSSPPPTGQESVAPLDSATAISPRPSSTIGSYSPVRTPPVRRARPLSMSSTNTYGSMARSSRIFGVPHAPHNQIQIVLPTPLASANTSRDSLPMPRGQYGAEPYDRRSLADPWISMPGHMSRSCYPTSLKKC